MSLRMNVILAACVALVLTAGLASADVVLYVTSREGRQLLKVNLTTNAITVVRDVTPHNPDSMLIDPQGRIIYDLADVNEVHRFDPNGAPASCAVPGGACPSDIVLLANANQTTDFQDMVLDPGGNSVLVSSTVGGTIIRISNLLAGPPFPATVLATIPSPQGLAYDNTGRLFAVTGTTVVQLNPTTGAVLNSSPVLNTPDGLTFDTFTNALYATSRLGNFIYKIDPTTLIATVLPGSTIPTPDGIITNNNGLLYIASRGLAGPPDFSDARVYSYNLLTNTATPLTIVPGLDDLGGFAISPPTILKTFGAPNIIFPGGTTTMTFTITNTNTVVLNGINFVDTLPAGLMVATPNGLVGSCDGGTITAVAGSGTVSLGIPTAATLAAGASCTFTVNVTATALGPATNPQNNCVTVNATGVGNGNTSCALISVLAAPPVLLPPTITKAFGAPSIPLNGTTTLSFTINNPNAAPGTLTAVGFTDMLPPGLVVANPNGLPNGTCTGTITAAVGSGTVSLAGATLAGGASCTFFVNVTGTTIDATASPTAPCPVLAGMKNNCVTVFDTVVGTGNTASAALIVVGPPAIAKRFGVGSILVGDTTSLTFTITNPNPTTTLTGVNFSDTLPAGLVISTPNGLTGSCGGGPITAVAGTTLISLTGATLAAGASCTFSVNVTATVASPPGGFVNTTNNVTATGPFLLVGNTATATLVVAVPAPPTYQIRYAANLDKGDSYVNLTNAGTLNGFDPAGRICVNVYTFDPAEEMVSCCACPVTPNGLNSLSVRNDLISNTLTAGTPTSVVIKLLASVPLPGNVCNAASPNASNLVRGMRAWGTTLHALPGVPVAFGKTETPFSAVELSASELAKLTSFCGFIQANGSGFGICKSCRQGALGADLK